MKLEFRSASVLMIFIPLVSFVGMLIGIEYGISSVLIFSVLFCVLSYYLYLKSNSYIIVTNTVLLFPFIGSIYLLTYPFLRFILRVLPTDIRGISDKAVLEGTFFGGTMLILYIAILVFLPKQNYKEDDEVLLYKRFSLDARNIFIDLAFFLVILYMIWRYIQIGGYTAIFTGSVSRQMMSKELEVIPFYSYIKYAYISYTVYSIYSFLNSEKGTQRKYALAFRALIVFVFWAIDLSLGNRRGLIYVILAMILYMANSRGDKIKPIYYVLIAVVIVSFIFVGVYRNALNTNSEFRIRDAFGEAIYPMVTLYYYIGNKIRPFYGGLTLLYFISSIIPRALWPDKPISLANQFKIDYYNTSMGYAFTPFSEMYVNFSYFGIVIGAILYIIIFNYFSKNKTRFPILYLATYMEIVNFFRGEFTSSIMEIIIMYITLKVLCIVNREIIYYEESNYDQV